MINQFRTYINSSGLGPIVVKAVIGSAGLRLIGMVFSFLVGVQLARGLGAEGYGIYGLAMSIIALLTVPTEFGLPQLVTREVSAAQVANAWGRMRGILRWAMCTSLMISLGVASFVLLWLALSGHGLDSPLGKTLLVGLFMVPLVAQNKINSAALSGLQHIVKGQLPNILVRPGLFSLFLFVMPYLITPLNPSLAMGLGVMSAALAFFSATLMLRKEMPKTVLSAKPIIDRRYWWSSALPMALTEGMRLLQGHLVILLLGIMSTVTMVGVYRVVNSVMIMVAFPISLLNVVSAPIISRLYAQGDKERLQRLLLWISLSMTGCILVLMLPFLVEGKLLLRLVFGADFAGGNSTLLLLCTGAVCNGFFGANAALLNMTGHQGRVTRASGLSLTLLTVILPPFIKFAGIEGAAVGSSLSIGVWNYIMWRDALRLLLLDSSVGAYLRIKKKV